MTLLLTLACAAGPLCAQGTFEFGLGLDALFEHQENLNLESIRTTVTVRDARGGGESVTEVPGDPALLNRKFDFLSELEGEGAHGSIALTTLGPIRPTFYWQALSADLRLDFLDRPEPTESTSIEGRGLLYGAGFDLVAALCDKCGWFAEAGYLLQDMPSFDADRRPRLLGEDLSRDRVRLRRRAHDASFRIGYGLPGSRVIPYTGVRRRSTDLDIEDELAFRGRSQDGTLEETRLRTRTTIQGDATLAVAGLHMNFGGGLFGRLETAIGDGDRVVMMKLVYLRSKATTTGDAAIEEDKKLEERARAIAAGILARLIAIEKEYVAGWRGLSVVAGDGGDPSYLVGEVEALLQKTESALLGVTNDYPELQALGDWIKDEFERARAELGFEAAGRITDFEAAGLQPASARGAGTRYVFAAALLQAPGRGPALGKTRTDSTLGRVRDRPVGIPRRAAEVKDGMITRFRFETDLGNQPIVFIFPRYAGRTSIRAKSVPPGELRPVVIGSYAYEVLTGENETKPIRKCDPNQGPSRVSCPLELIPGGCKILSCRLKTCYQVDCLTGQ